MRTGLCVPVVFVAAMAAAVVSAGEEAGGASVEKTAVYLQAGLSSGGLGGSGAVVGGSIARDVGARLAVEGSASYLGRGMGASGLRLTASLLVHLRARHERAVPYLAVGGGLYRAAFDMAAGPQPGPAAFGWMPMFYGNRMTGRRGDRFGHETFTDPAIDLGGGIRIDLGSKLFLRPDGRALIVTSNGDTDTIGIFTVSVGYRF